jgi:hypothetical protein
VTEEQANLAIVGVSAIGTVFLCAAVVVLVREYRQLRIAAQAEIAAYSEAARERLYEGTAVADAGPDAG